MMQRHNEGLGVRGGALSELQGGFSGFCCKVLGKRVSKSTLGAFPRANGFISFSFWISYLFRSIRVTSLDHLGPMP